MGKASGGETFLPLGAEQDAPALPEEIIYYDDEGAVCRCLNWREAQRTMLTEKTTDAILIIESINPEQAIQELRQLVDSYFHTESLAAVLTASHPSFAIEP